MAKNAPYGDGHRQGQVTERSQVHNLYNDQLGQARLGHWKVHRPEGG